VLFGLRPSARRRCGYFGAGAGLAGPGLAGDDTGPAGGASGGIAGRGAPGFTGGARSGRTTELVCEAW
jgi:hypothetical protein